MFTRIKAAFLAVLLTATAAQAQVPISDRQVAHTDGQRVNVVLDQINASLATKQPLDSDLTSIANLATTSYGRDFLTRADAGAARSYINAQIAGTYATGTGTANGTNTGDETTATITAKFPALTGDVTTPGASAVTTLATAQTTAHTWSGVQSQSNVQSIFGANANASLTMILNGAAGSTRVRSLRSANIQRWTDGASGASDSYIVFAYKDDGNVSGTLLQGERFSGPVGGGKPYFSSVVAGVHNVNRATTPNGVSGDYFNYSDTQPTTTLAANPITTNGTTSVVLSWPSHGLTTAANVNITGATAVGGVTLSGFYRITATTTNTITVKAASAATAATGGGSAVLVTPDFASAGVRMDFATAAAGSGFHDGTVEYFQANPSHYITTASNIDGPAYQAKFAAGLSPSDTSQLNAWSLSGFELDVVNRGADEGYQPNIFTAPRPVFGYLSVPENLSQFAGNEGKNATAAYITSKGLHANSTGYFTKWYQGYVVSPDALVSNSAGLGGHGGIGLDVFGAGETLNANPLSVTAGSSTVRVTVPAAAGNLLTAHNTPTNAYFPVAVTLSGVTISAGPHAISNVTATTFDVVGTGSAAATVSGGGSALGLISFDKDVPWAPAKFSGEFLKGILFDGRVSSGAMLDATGAFLVSGVDLSAATLTGNAFASPGFSVGPTGTVTLGVAPVFGDAAGTRTALGAASYAEGTWTPTVTFATPGTLAVSYATQTGSYVRIGNQVTLYFTVTFTPTIGTATGNLYIQGFGFTISDTTTPTGSVRGLGATFTWPTGRTQAVLNTPTSTAIGLSAAGTGVAAVAFTATNLTSGAAHTITGSISFKL